MRVLVTGGNRYIGLSLVRTLAKQGHDVTVFNSHEADLPAGVRRIHGDRRIPGVLHDTLAPYRDSFDAIFDNTAYGPSDLEPMLALFSGRVQHFVFTSSSAVYRRSLVHPVTESFSTHAPDDPAPAKSYGVGKVQCENFLLEQHRTNGFPATVLRVGHTIGPRSPLATRDPIYFARLETQRPILIPGDGFAFLHLIHIDDVASLMASVLGNPKAAGQTYNVSGSEVASLLNCVRVMGRVVGVEPNIVHVPMSIAKSLHRPLVHWGEGIMGGAVFSAEKAQRELGWRPKFGLESGYRDSYEWFADGGRSNYEFDFSFDDEILAKLSTG